MDIRTYTEKALATNQPSISITSMRPNDWLVSVSNGEHDTNCWIGAGTTKDEAIVQALARLHDLSQKIIQEWRKE